MLFTCQICGSEHASGGALRVHRSKVHRKQPRTRPRAIGVEEVKEEAPRHRQLPQVVFVESVVERRSRKRGVVQKGPFY